MKKFVVFMMVGLMAVSVPITAQAGDQEWEDAGKVLTILEGLRVLSGGRVDPIGTLGGVNRNDSESIFSSRKDRRHNYKKRRKHHSHYDHHPKICMKKEWIPQYRWEKKYVPEHTSYDDDHGQVIVESHYIRYQVEDGGHWKRVSTPCRY